jgi:hypothetical protein
LGGGLSLAMDEYFSVDGYSSLKPFAPNGDFVNVGEQIELNYVCKI